MDLRKATLNDIDIILEIIHQAKLYLKSQNIDQWQNGYPNLESTLKDINDGNSYVICEDNKVIATAAIIDDIDPNYEIIEDGQWKSSFDYICVHRVACLPNYKGRGVAGMFLEYAKKLNRNSVRIDTHEENKSMQRMILKHDFKYCGIVYMSDGAKRFAYEWVGEKDGI